jgi:Icc-related predicted phosphoesterase
MRIVHLSDIHLQPKGADSSQQKVINALCRDLTTISHDKIIDLVVFSGDIAYRGNTTQEFVENANENFFKAIRSSISRPVPIVLCPGNHDVNLGARDDIFDPIFEAVDSPAAADNTFEKISKRGVTGLFDHMAGYISLAKKLSASAYSTNPFYYTESIEVDGVKFGIVSINSTWLTKGGGHGDYGQLFVSERQIDLALSEVQDCAIKIAVMHHTLKWLHPSEGSVIQRLLATNFHAVLCGHNHENNASGIVGNIGSIFISNTGCIYETREYFNGYSVLDLDLERQRWIVSAREYFYQRDEFSSSPRFAENGTCEYSLKSDPGANIVVIPSAVITEIQDRASSKLLSYTASEVAPKQVGAMFVEPPLATVDEKQFQNANGDESKYISLAELARTTENLLIAGKRESGKTLLLHEIAANRFMDFAPDARIGIVVDLGTVSKFTEAAVLEQLVEGTGGELRRRDIVDLLQHGRALVCIDNVHIHHEKHLSLIRGFFKKYNNVRYLLGVPEEFHTALSVADKIPDMGMPVRRIFIHSFRRRQIREMVKRWFGEDHLLTGVKFELVNQLLSQLNVPATPFLVSVLLWVIEQRPQASPVNQAAAIEVLIEGLLEKLKESKSRVGFDSTIQMHFLSDLAVHLDSIGAEWLAALEFDAFVVDYFKRKGLQVSTVGFAEELQRKGLLYSTSERVTFKFDCFRAYFLAKRFAESPTLWQKALTTEQIHRYTTEIDLFTGLYRDKRDVLESSLALCRQLFVETALDVDLNATDSFSSVPQIINNAGLDSLEQDLLISDYDESHREARLDEIERPSSASLDHENSRKRNQFERSSDELLFVAALRTLSIVTRNSELVDDVGLKQNALSTAIEYWAKFLISALDIVMKADFEEIDLGSLLPKAVSPDKARNTLVLLLPQAIIAMMSECLSTPKLQVFLEKEVVAKEAIIACFAALLSLDSNERNAPKMVKDVLQRFGRNKLIVQVVFFKLLSVYYWNNLTPSQVVSVRECLAEAFSIFRDAPAKQKATTKTMFLANLDRQKAIAGIKMANE